MHPLRALVLGSFLFTGASASAATLSNLIVDQFGWRTGSAKVAILAQPQSGQGSPSAFTPGAGFEIRRSSDNAVVFSNTVTAWNAGATHAQSGDRGWWADFSALSTPGSYYLSLPGGSNPGAQSYAFDLKEDAYSAALNASVKSYYYQRCGTAISATHGGAWNHATCHNATQATARLYDNGDQGAGTARDVRGGWHDAGDYRKYTSFNYSLIWDLMTAYEWNPCAFGDATGIPESGNGVPDLVDELKWELDWLLRMQATSGPDAGALYSGVFVTTMGSNGGDGDPSLENTNYWYANFSSGATATGCMALAKGARLLQPYAAAYPGYYGQLSGAAQAAWNWLQANPGNLTYDHSGFNNANANIDAADDFGRRLGAAAELYRLSGDPAYRAYFDANYNSSAGSVNGGTYHPILNNEFWPSAALSLQQACISYVQAPSASAGVVNAIRTALKNGADNRVLFDQNAATDLYRGYMWDGYYGWGSNGGKSRWGGLAVWAWKLGVGSAAEQAAYQRAGEEYLHYLHGRNPLNWCYLTNMGPEGANAGAEQSVNEIFHGWFGDGSLYDGFSGGRIGPAPGILVGGTNQFYATDTTNAGGTPVYPPAGQPILKSYLNWNKVWPDASWSVTENSIGYQGPYTFLAAMYAPCAGPQPTATPTATPTDYAGTPTSTWTATPSPSATPTATPVCATLLNGAEALGENGSWAGANAVRSIVASGAAPAGAVTQGANALLANITVTAGWNDGFANLSGFAPANWAPYAELRFDLHLAPSLVAGATYAELQLRADCASCGAGLWYQPISADAPALVAGAQTISYTLDFSQGTIPAGSPLSRLILIYNNNATAPTGAFYIDNVRLVGACQSPTPTVTMTRTRTASPTASPTRTPSPSQSVTVSPTWTSFISSPTETPVVTATASSTSTPTPSQSSTAVPPGSSATLTPADTSAPSVSGISPTAGAVVSISDLGSSQAIHFSLEDPSGVDHMPGTGLRSFVLLDAAGQTVAALSTNDGDGMLSPLEVQINVINPWAWTPGTWKLDFTACDTLNNCADLSHTFTVAAPTPTPSASAVFSQTVTFTATRTPSLTPSPLPTLACPRRVQEFYAYWTRGSLPSSSLPYTKLTHIAHAFIRPLANGTLEVPGSFLDANLITQAHANGVKVLVSVGGAGEGVGDGSEFWSAAVLSPTARAALVDSLYDFCSTYGYDGVDIDYEFPDTVAERNAVTAFIQALRAKFASSPAPAPGWEITADVSWGSYYGGFWDVAAIKGHLDYFNIMAYDMFGSWNVESGHNAGLFDSSLPGAPLNTNGNFGLNYWIGRGVPAQQIQYGLPAYGYRYNTEDLYQSCGGVCSTATYMSYTQIAALIGAGWTRYYDSSAESPYLREDAGTRTISYDDPQSIQAKTVHALWVRGVAGVFLWELSQDRSAGNNPLLDAAWAAASCSAVTPTNTPTISPTYSASPTWTATRTATPSRTPTPTRSPTRTASETGTATLTETPAILSPTSTATPSHTPLPGTPTVTAVVPSLTPSQTSVTPATATPSPAPTALPGDGSLSIQVLQGWPQPNPSRLSLKLSGSADRVRLSLYTPAWTCVAKLETGPMGPGWNQMSLLGLADPGLAAGLYYLEAKAYRGAVESAPVSAKLYRLR